MAWDYRPGNRKPFADGRREWEPEDEDAFWSADPLNPAHHDWGETLRLLYHSGIEFAAWSQLPALLRGQAWRERELSAFLRGESYRNRWDEQPILEGFEKMAVGRRPWEAVGPPGIGVAMAVSDRLRSYREALCAGEYWKALYEYHQLDKDSQQLLRWHPLAIVLWFQESVDRGPHLYDDLHLEPFLQINSRIQPLEDYGLHEVVPVVIEESRKYEFRSSSSISGALQGGQSISSRINTPDESTGTLTCIVEYSHSGPDSIGLLGPQHVFGGIGESVYQDGTKIGEVIFSDPSVDVALAEMAGTPQWSREILNRNLDPAAPLEPVSGMPGEYFGARSQHIEESYIGLVYVEPPSFYNLGKTPRFEMEGFSMHGDSGALVLSGHNQQDAKSTNLACYLPSLNPDQLSAILGMLMAGADADPDCERPGIIFATPAKDIQAALLNKGFEIRWLTR